jgi:hypothetical protein
MRSLVKRLGLGETIHCRARLVRLSRSGGVIALVIVLCSIAPSARALSIAQSWPLETLSTAPLVRLSHGWSGGEIYDMTLEIGSECTTHPVRLLFAPTKAPTLDLNTSNPATLDVHLTTPTVWASYDLNPSDRYRVQLVNQYPYLMFPEGVEAPDYVTTGPATLRAAWMHRRGWTDYVDLVPGQTARFQLRFPLPPMELDRRLKPRHAPSTVTLTIEHLDLGCTTPLTIRRTFPLNGRDLLLKLGPRAR